MRITRFNKAIVGGIALIVNTLNGAIADDVIDMTEKQRILSTVMLVGFSIWTIYRVPNDKISKKGDV